jgi:hypothetical protein
MDSLCDRCRKRYNLAVHVGVQWPTSRLDRRLCGVCAGELAAWLNRLDDAVPTHAHGSRRLAIGSGRG